MEVKTTYCVEDGCAAASCSPTAVHDETNVSRWLNTSFCGPTSCALSNPLSICSWCAASFTVTAGSSMRVIQGPSAVRTEAVSTRPAESRAMCCTVNVASALSQALHFNLVAELRLAGSRTSISDKNCAKPAASDEFCLYFWARTSARPQVFSALICLSSPRGLKNVLALVALRIISLGICPINSIVRARWSSSRGYSSEALGSNK
mmetsp:Transcript_45582/g.120483  ORF Transcript_45582/g.120483 Transcript_45582/m.120483 type:complete len:206 (+) Transcript_45582:314-931(+)